MKNPKVFIYPLAFLIGGLFSCSEESIPTTPEQTSKGIEYFPLEVGQYTEYKARRITHFELVADDTSDFYILVANKGGYRWAQLPELGMIDIKF